jgi:hypothetical protein
MPILVFHDPLAQRESSATEHAALSEVRTPQRGKGLRKWRRGPDKRQYAKSLVLQDLHLLASQCDSSGRRSI